MTGNPVFRAGRRTGDLVGAHGDALVLDSRFHGNDKGFLRSTRNDMFGSAPSPRVVLGITGEII
jgi:hypothetical protein